MKSSFPRKSRFVIPAESPARHPRDAPFASFPAKSPACHPRASGDPSFSPPPNLPVSPPIGWTGAPPFRVGSLRFLYYIPLVSIRTNSLTHMPMLYYLKCNFAHHARVRQAYTLLGRSSGRESTPSTYWGGRYLSLAICGQRPEPSWLKTSKMGWPRACPGIC